MLRDDLIDDVLEAVARLGLGNLSLRALSRELGVSPRTEIVNGLEAILVRQLVGDGLCGGFQAFGV